MDDGNVLRVSVSELMARLRWSLIRLDPLVDKMCWYAVDGHHDAWDQLIKACFDAIVRQPVESIVGRPYTEFGLPVFGMPLSDPGRYSWICPALAVGRQVVWGVEPWLRRAEAFNVAVVGDGGLVFERTVPWGYDDEFVLVRRGPGVPDLVVSEIVSDD
ncbi:MAG: hypothetical protein LBI99_04470 [Propionibacteriaceae bacterium]|nr:hypothetical protein [Propionibacteriaceae bacterium]